jgi:septal ring factor EnvC (AmiA/AmiB activator)
MKLKSLEKKIRRLEARLRAGPRKLAKLKRKLEAMSAAKARKAQKKAAARAVARQTVQSLTATPKKTVAVGKIKRKLNLSPERRAQLSAAMKARWAAKRASAEPNLPSASHDQGSAIGGVDRAV